MKFAYHARLGGHLLVLLAALLAPRVVTAQQPAPAAAAEEEDLPPIIDSRSGYVDSAILMNQVRIRYDMAYNNRQPTRGEFFYARTGTSGPGLPLEERSVDFQDLSLYAERRFGDSLSAFVEVPFRFANFDINEDHSGLSDINTGFKYALVSDEETVLTSQFRVYVPSGNARRGLGNHHVSLEPALLLFEKLSDRLSSESELRYWGSVGGSAHTQGSLFRYGTGMSYELARTGNTTAAPVAEIVGWTFIDGEKDAQFGLPASVPMRNAAGDTIVNAKLGVRFQLDDVGSFYAGYGRALTGEVFYKDMFRFEFRLLY